LKVSTDKAEQALSDKALELDGQGNTQRQIAVALGISVGKVNKLLRVHAANEQREQDERVNTPLPSLEPDDFLVGEV